MSDQLLSNVVILDVSKQSNYFNYFIIATGMTTQHLQSSSTEISKYLKSNDIKISLYIIIMKLLILFIN